MKLFIVFFSLDLINKAFAHGNGGSAAKTSKQVNEASFIINACNTGLTSYLWGYDETSSSSNSSSSTSSSSSSSSKHHKRGHQTTSTTSALCAYEPAVASMLICFEEKFGAYSKIFNASCKSYASTCSGTVTWNQTSLYALYDNSTKYAVEYDSSIDYTTTILYSPIIVPMSDVNPTYKSNYEVAYNLDIANTFSGIMYIYFIFIFILFTIANFLKRIGLHRKLNNPVINWYRANISIPAAFNDKHTDAKVWFKFISTLVPTRVEAIVSFLFICLNVLLATVNYHPSGTSETTATILYKSVANRTGVLSFGLVPLLIVFAGRNNIITTITGIPYTSMIVYHKWIARAMWIHALVHSICWTGFALYSGRFSNYVSRLYWQWGIVATTIGGLIIFQAFRLFRNASYEVFLFIHIVFAAVFIAGCYWHCYNLGYLEWLYASWAVWAFDRFIRIINIASTGIPKADLEYVGDQTFKMTVPYNKLFNPFPGSYAYIYFFSRRTFWQSHPFSFIKSVEKDGHLTFYIKEKNGATKIISKLLEKSTEGKLSLRVGIEGPYGHRAPTEKYNKVLFFGGGNGIPGLFSHIMDLTSRESSSKQELKLYWVVRSLESLSWFNKELKALASTQTEVNIYITGRKTLEDSTSSSESKHESSGNEKESTEDEYNKLTFMEKGEELKRFFKDRFSFYESRPDVDQIIIKEFSDPNGPSIAVSSCGPPKMVDQVRASTANHLQESKGRIDLFEELQVW